MGLFEGELICKNDFKAGAYLELGAIRGFKVIPLQYMC